MGDAAMPSVRDAMRVWPRNARVFSRVWNGALPPLFLDPLFYLVSLGFGLGTYLATGPDAAAVLGNALWLLVVTVTLFFAIPARAMHRRLVG